MLDKLKQNWFLILLIIILLIFIGLKINDEIRVNSLNKEIKSLESKKQKAIVLKEFWENKATQSEVNVGKMEVELKIYKDSLVVAKARIKYIKKYYDEKIVNVDGVSLNTSIEFITGFYR